MKPSQPRLLRALGIVFALFTLLCLYGTGRNLWKYSRMRTIPVEVVRSSLLIDVPPEGTGDPSDVDYTLRLDLVTTDGTARPIHWEDVPARAAYPEEAFDELTRWAPGARHEIFQLRGEARAIRLPGASDSQELDAAIFLLCATLFLGFFALTFVALASEESPWFLPSWLKQHLGVWLVFFSVGMVALGGDFLFITTQLPKIISWPTAVATGAPPPAEYDSSSLPPNVVITAAARQRIKAHSHTVLTFQWNGATLHGGLGANEGPYDALAHDVCRSTDPPCRFKISPTDRWNVAAKPGWNVEFFMPVGMFTLFGVAFTGAGLMIRRDKF